MPGGTRHEHDHTLREFTYEISWENLQTVATKPSEDQVFEPQQTTIYQAGNQHKTGEKILQAYQVITIKRPLRACRVVAIFLPDDCALVHLYQGHFGSLRAETPVSGLGDKSLFSNRSKTAGLLYPRAAFKVIPLFSTNNFF